MSQEIVIGKTRFSPGCKVKRTAIAAANGSPLLIHVRLSFPKRPSFEKEFHTWSPASGENVVSYVISTPGDCTEAIAHWPSQSASEFLGRMRLKMIPLTW